MPESLAAALAELQANPPRIGKRAKAQYGNYADLPAVHKALMPRLTQLGLLWQTWITMDTEGRLVLRYSLTHMSDHVTSLMGDIPIESTDPQRRGSEITYYRRYALVTVTGVTPEGDDDDGQAASRQRTPTKIPGPGHERLRNGTVIASPDDRPAERVKAGDNPPVDMWMDNATSEYAEDRPGTADARQLRDMGIAFTNAGITDKAVRLGMVSDMIGRTVISSKQLSRAEATFVLQALRKQQEATP